MRPAALHVFLAMALIATVSSGPLHRSKRWSVHSETREPAPELTGGDLIDVLTASPDIRYSDWGKRLTAVKSSKFKACFIADLDPGFNPSEDVMEQFTLEKIPQTVDTPSDLWSLRSRAGRYITAMCQRSDLYWLNEVAPPAPVANGNDLQVKLPEPIAVRVHETRLPISDVRAPPPVNVYRSAQQSSGPKVPPPLNVYHQQQANQNVQLSETVTQAPPPVNLFRQLANQNVHHTEAHVPPPISVYHEQQAKENIQQTETVTEGPPYLKPQANENIQHTETITHAPPPVNLFRQLANQNTESHAPPPLNLFHEQQANQNVQQTETVTQAPPPLNLFHQQQANQNVQLTETITRAPPPLSLWRSGS